MESISEELPNLKRMMQMLAAQFGKDSEIVLHDLSKDYSHTIVAIENSWVTGRNVGDGGTNLGLEVLRNPPCTNGDLYTYFNKTADGRMLRSSTFYFRNSKGMAIGSLCINTDITTMVQMQDMLQNQTMLSTNQEVEEVFANRVEDLFEFFIKQGLGRIGKDVSDMTMDDKIEMVRVLDSKGFFLITHSSDEACKFLGISKYTLYTYIGIVRGKNTELPEELV
jgi:predicted transcriptional regulator YheO